MCLSSSHSTDRGFTVQVECELTPIKEQIKAAREMRDKTEEKMLRARQSELRERQRVLQADLEIVIAHEDELNDLVSPVLTRLQKLEPGRDAALFAIINECGFETPPANPRIAMEERVNKRATKIVAETDARVATKKEEAEVRAL
jgi:hypothetical protein